jgi:hypothetical protein
VTHSPDINIITRDDDRNIGVFLSFFLANMLLIYRRGRGVPESGKASKPEEPARKPQTVREYHRAHEAEILPHVRRGLYLQDY